MLPLRAFQKEALDAIGPPGHVICVAPTGSGKSLIYERWAQATGARLLLVTPLVALARQQAARLGAAGLTVRLGAGSFARTGRSDLPAADTRAWIASPEMLAGEERGRVLERWRPDLLVVDECHCLWEWGEEFRPAFGRLPDLIARHRIPRSLWLTATLPREARVELESRLPAPVRRLGIFRLPERLRVEVARSPLPDRAAMLTDWIRGRDGAGIVFVQSRNAAARISRYLSAAGIAAVPYHAGMSAEEREGVERAVRAGQPRAVVATSAFGMGMDFRHLRWVAVAQVPASLLALAQALGRVGRGEDAGEALVLWDPEDFRLTEWMVGGSPRRLREWREVARFCGSEGCREIFLTNYFDQMSQVNCRRCDRCIA